MAYEGPRSHRPLIIGRRGAVASNHPLATQAGLLALQAGGNAVDAAVAVAATLSVVEPFMSGLGGDGFYHVHMRRTGESVVFNGTGPAPRAATPGALRGRHPAVRTPRRLGPRLGGRVGRDARAVRPAALGLAASRPRSTTPATGSARLAPAGTSPASRSSALRADPQKRQGIPPRRAARRARHADRPAGPRAHPRAPRRRRRRRLLPRRHRAAARRRLPARPAAWWARTTSPRSSPRSQAPIELALPRLHGPRGAAELHGLGAPPGARHRRALRPRRDGRRSPPTSSTRWSRRRSSRSPTGSGGAATRGSSRRPLAELLSRRRISPGARRRSTRSARRRPARRRPRSPGDTTYFCVVDGEGNAVSGIQSLNSAFGSGVTAGDTGILLNNRMTPWHLEPGHPNRLAPGKRVRHTMNPPMVFKDGELWAVFGTPGGDYQVQVNLQVLTAMVDFGYDPQQAAEMPRWSSTQPGQEANWPHDCPDALNLEARFPAEVRAELAGRGHPVVATRRPRRPVLRRDHPPRRRHRHAHGRLRSPPRRLGPRVLGISGRAAPRCADVSGRRPPRPRPAAPRDGPGAR